MVSRRAGLSATAGLSCSTTTRDDVGAYQNDVCERQHCVADNILIDSLLGSCGLLATSVVYSDPQQFQNPRAIQLRTYCIIFA